MVHERSEVVYFDKDYIIASSTIGKYNRTTPVANVDLEIVKEMPSDVEVLILLIDCFNILKIQLYRYRYKVTSWKVMSIKEV